MTPLLPLTNISAFQVPEDATKYLVMKVCQPQTFSYEYSISKGNGKFQSGLIAFIDLPPGNWSFICTSKECTEEQAAKIVSKFDTEGRGCSYLNYQNGMYLFAKPKSSFRSLLTSKKITGNCAIIKKEE